MHARVRVHVYVHVCVCVCVWGGGGEGAKLGGGNIGIILLPLWCSKSPENS